MGSLSLHRVWTFNFDRGMERWGEVREGGGYMSVHLMRTCHFVLNGKSDRVSLSHEPKGLMQDAIEFLIVIYS